VRVSADDVLTFLNNALWCSGHIEEEDYKSKKQLNPRHMANKRPKTKKKATTKKDKRESANID
jgi:hypothetical protein